MLYCNDDRHESPCSQPCQACAEEGCEQAMPIELEVEKEEVNP